MKKLLLLCIALAFTAKIYPQCLNADFSDGTFQYWQGSRGENSSGIYSGEVIGLNQGVTNSLPINTGQQTIITQGYFDPNTNNLLWTIPPVGNSCARLGNSQIGASAERLYYPINVTSNNYIFTYQYAVVLEDPSHTLTEQPKFTVYILDANGHVVDPVWGVLEVTAQHGLPGWHDGVAVENIGGLDRWKEWTAVTVDLSPYIGQIITAQFTTFDCSLTGHFGYAYISCYCGTGLAVILDSLVNANCANNDPGSILVHGIGGIGNYTYQWSNGATTPGITNLNAGVYTVTVTDSNNVSASSSFYITSSSNMYASVVATTANCTNNGTASVLALGGHPPYTYLWSDSLAQTTPTAVGLSPGNYSVGITDSLGCEIFGHVLVHSTCMNFIKGRVYQDLNQNCIQDIGENGIPNAILHTTPGYYYGSADALGDFTIMTPFMNNTLYAPNMYSYYSLNCPVSGLYNIAFNQLGDTSSGNDFAYDVDTNYFDLIINPIMNVLHPGWNTNYHINYSNYGFSPQNVLIQFFYDSLLQYTSCTQGGIHYPAQHKIEWTINNVPPNFISNWYNCPVANFYIPTNVVISTILHSAFAIFPVTGDAVPANNTLDCSQMVSGSYDPNDKSVSPVGEGVDGYITQSDSILFYTIHFQNTGTDTAFTVVIVDTLSSFLDPATVVPGAATHAYTFNMSGQGIITFRFDQIFLPDSNVNEPESNGYVNFTVRQKPNNPDGSVISNTAAIYFDFNDPVITNTVINTIAATVGIADEIQDIENLYPNPASEYITMITSQKATINILTIQGQLLKSLTANGKKTTIDVSALPAGVYIVEVKTDKGVAVKKFVKE